MGCCTVESYPSRPGATCCFWRNGLFRLVGHVTLCGLITVVSGARVYR
jgi:hypothetical protein